MTLNGVIYKRKTIDLSTVQKFKKILIKNQAIGKDNLSGFFPATYKSIIKNLFNLNFSKAYYGYLFVNFSKKNNFKKLADQYFGFKSKLIKIDSYISEVSNEKIIDWHTDQAHSGKMKVKKENLINPKQGILKFFLFLTDVEKDDGDLAYIPQSHKILFELKNLIFKGQVEYQPHWSVKQVYKMISSNKIRKIIIDEGNLSESELDDFLNNISFIVKSDDTKKFDKYCDAGDLMIFDEHGIHRASAPITNTRFVMRFLYSREDFY